MSRVSRSRVPLMAQAAALVVVVAVLAWFLVLPAPAAESTDAVGFSAERLARISEMVDRHVEAGTFSGAVTLVARHGRIAHLEAHGLMDLEQNTPMRTDAIFRIMSMTKPVVGVAILMVMEDGAVRLTDPVSRFIPEFRGMQVAVPEPGQAGGGRGRGAGPGAAPPRFDLEPAQREVTVRDLLTHTSGVVSGTISNREAQRVAAQGEDTLADYIPRLGQVPLEFQPGARWAYSAAAGFDVLARIVEVASGLPFDEFARQRIFEPLGMHDTSFVPDEANPRMTRLYQRTADGLRPQNNPGFMNGVYFSGGGGLLSTAEDYLRFGLMLANDGALDGRRLLSPRSVEMMRALVIPDTLPGRQRGEGFGLSVRVVNDPVARSAFLSEGSYGWSGLYGTHFWVDPKEKLVAVFMSQTSSQEVLRDFENLVMYSVVGPGAAVGP
jgi:CubicO group peptidase (beta-lactamase class C family)